MSSWQLFAMMLALLLAGCASSERMMRTSGGVLQDYSAPKKKRLTSGKFPVSNPAKAVQSERDRQQGVGGIRDTLVNIWPFFFRNRDYIACLWPMIDYDPYGFAVRPFFNQEGDDYSILFPLSAWNPAKRHGWVLNTYWNWAEDEDFCGFFPLFHHGPTGGYYTPLWVTGHKENRKHDPIRNPRISEDFNLIALLFYYNSDVWWRTVYERGLEKQVKSTERYGGMFPLCHWESDMDRTSFRFLGWLPHYQNDKRETDFRFLGWLLGGYTDERAYGLPSVDGYAGERTWGSFALLTWFHNDCYYTDTPQARAFAYLTKDGEKLLKTGKRAEIDRELEIISPGAKLPAELKNMGELRRYLDELQEAAPPERKAYTTGGFLPLYWQDIEKNGGTRVLPALITWWNWDKDESSFFSLPLLTYVGSEPMESTTAVFWPFGYYSNEKRFKPEDAIILHPECLPGYGILAKRSGWSFCGLGHHDSRTFYTAKPGYDVKALESLRREIRSFGLAMKKLEARRAALAKRRKKVWPRRDKIEEYTYLIELERIRIEEEAIAKAAGALDLRAGKIVKQAAAAHLELDPREQEKAMKAIFGACEEFTRDKIGSLFFYERETDSRGGFRWQTLFKLASGEGASDREDTQVLQLLYRHKRRGNKSETVYFPFVSIQRDGEDSRVRFLWRVWERTVEKGRTSGHILFIPYGNP